MRYVIIIAAVAVAFLGAPLDAQEPAAESAVERVEHGLSAVEQVLERAGVGPIVESALTRLLRHPTFDAQAGERLGVEILQAVVRTLAAHVGAPPGAADPASSG